MSWIEFRDVIGLVFRVTERLKTSKWREGGLGVLCSLTEKTEEKGTEPQGLRHKSVTWC